MPENASILLLKELSRCYPKLHLCKVRDGVGWTPNPSLSVGAFRKYRFPAGPPDTPGQYLVEQDLEIALLKFSIGEPRATNP